MDTALLLLADGRFPTGGHAQSAGVEAAVATGDVHDEASLRRYLDGRLATTGVVDAAFGAAAGARFAGVDPHSAFHELDRELDARIRSPRTRLVSRRLGRQLLRVGRSAWPHPLLDWLAAPPGPHQALASGAMVAAAGGTPDHAARLAMHHLAAAVTGAAVRLLGLDPFAAAAMQADVAALVDQLVAPVATWATCAPADLPAVGGALTEILAEHHGAWDARLFVA
ncbi:urease accessory UreF family protein [soil metagenome]